MKYTIPIFMIILVLLSSCRKENIDNIDPETPIYEPVIVDCADFTSTIVLTPIEVSLTANATGGVEPYTYNWSNGNTTASITPTESETFSVTIADNEGCTTVSTYDYEKEDPIDCSDLVVIVELDMSTGALISTVTGGEAPYIYSWSVDQSTPIGAELNLMPSVDGEYFLVVTDARGCGAYDSYQYTNQTLGCETFSVGLSTDETLSLTALVAGGTAPYVFLWQDGITAANSTVTDSGRYSITVTDSNGCAESAFIDVNADDGCFGLNATAIFDETNSSWTVFVSGGTAPYTYDWSNGVSGVPSLENLSTGTYILTITDSVGCTLMTLYTVS